MPESNFTEALREASFHLHHMKSASKSIAHLFPLSVERYDSLSKEDDCSLLNFTMQFVNLCRSIEGPLFETALILNGDTFDSEDSVDIVKRVEEVGLIMCSERWSDIQDIYKQVNQNNTHHRENVLLINRCFSAQSAVELAIVSIGNYIASKFSRRK